jgi:hypothetical protein
MYPNNSVPDKVNAVPVNPMSVNPKSVNPMSVKVNSVPVDPTESVTVIETLKLLASLGSALGNYEGDVRKFLSTANMMVKNLILFLF